MNSYILVFAGNGILPSSINIGNFFCDSRVIYDQGCCGNTVVTHIAIAILVRRTYMDGNSVAVVCKNTIVKMIISAAMPLLNAHFT